MIEQATAPRPVVAGAGTLRTPLHSPQTHIEPSDVSSVHHPHNHSGRVWIAESCVGAVIVVREDERIADGDLDVVGMAWYRRLEG